MITSAGDQDMPEGLGFAIPVNLVRGVMQQLVAHGRVIRGYLGVDEAQELPANQARVLGIDGPAVLITCTSGPAAAAGLRPGDVLTHLDGERMYAPQEAMNFVASLQPGERIAIRVTRANGTPFATEAVLEERPPPGDRLTLARDAANVGAEQPELGFDALVAAIDVVDAIDERRALRRSPASTNDADARRSVAMTGAPVEPLDPARDDGVALNRQVRAEPLQLEDVLEAVLEDRLGDRGRAFGDCVQGTELRLHVRRKRWIRRRLDVDGARPTAAHVELDPIGARVTFAPASVSFCSTASRCSGLARVSRTRRR